MIYNAVAVDKHTETTTQHIGIYWAGKKKILEDVIRAVPQKDTHLSRQARCQKKNINISGNRHLESAHFSIHIAHKSMQLSFQ